MGRTDKYKKREEEKEVDLIPFMNLIAILIPALMYSTEFVKIASLAVSSPRIGPSQPAQVDKPDEKPPLNLTIAISSIGLYIASANNVLPGSEGQQQEQAAGPTIPKVTAKSYSIQEPSGKVKEMMRVWEFNGKTYNLGIKPVTSEGISQRVAGWKAQYGSVQIKDVLDHNYPALHEKLKVIKKAFEKERQVIISADPNVVFESVVRVMDATRNYQDEESGETKYLFPQVVLSAGVV